MDLDSLVAKGLEYEVPEETSVPAANQAAQV